MVTTMPDAYVAQWAVHSMVSSGPLNEIMTAKTEVTFDLGGISTRLRNITLRQLRTNDIPSNWSKSGHMWHVLAAYYGFGPPVVKDAHTGYFCIPTELFDKFNTAATLMGGRLQQQGDPHHSIVTCWWSTLDSKQPWGSTIDPLMRGHNIYTMYEAGRQNAIDAIISQQKITLTIEV